MIIIVKKINIFFLVLFSLCFINFTTAYADVGNKDFTNGLLDSSYIKTSSFTTQFYDNDITTPSAATGRSVSLNTLQHITGLSIKADKGVTVSFYSNSTVIYSFIAFTGTYSLDISNVDLIGLSGVTTTNYLYEIEFFSLDCPGNPKPPNIMSVTGGNDISNMSIDDYLYILFDQPIQANSGDITIPGVSFKKVYGNNSIKIIPNTNLDYDSNYTMSISNVLSSNGVPMEGTKVYDFKTEKDSTPIKILYIKPPPDSVNIPIDQKVEIKFNKSVNANTISNINVTKEGEIIPTTLNLSNDLITMSFNELLENNTTYFINISGVQDNLGNGLESNVSVSFTTIIDTTELILLEYKPPSGVITKSQDIEFTFNKNVNPYSVKYELIDSNGNVVNCSANVVGNKITFLPKLDYGSKYTFKFYEASTLTGELKTFNVVLNFEVMQSTDKPSWDSILSNVINFVNDIKSKGIKIILSFISLATIFLIAKWLFKKLKLWLKKS